MEIAIARMTKGSWDKVRAFFSVIFRNADGFELTINSCKLVEGPNGLFVSFPSEKKEVNGETKYYPITWLNDTTLKNVSEKAKEEYGKDESNFASSLPN